MLIINYKISHKVHIGIQSMNEMINLCEVKFQKPVGISNTFVHQCALISP